MAIMNGFGAISANPNTQPTLSRGAVGSGTMGSAQMTPEMLQALAASIAMQLAAAGMTGAQQIGQNLQSMIQSGGSVSGTSGGGGKGGANVVVIDDFNSSHGQEISQQIASGGVNTQNLNIGGQGDGAGRIASALDSVIAQVSQGGSVDAVNISQQNFNTNQNTQAVQQKIAQLQAMGVPVVVAAGNEGKGNKNQLAGTAAYVVENGSANSGAGNIRAQGDGTSQAAANVAIEVDKKHNG